MFTFSHTYKAAPKTVLLQRLRHFREVKTSALISTSKLPQLFFFKNEGSHFPLCHQLTVQSDTELHSKIEKPISYSLKNHKTV